MATKKIARTARTTKKAQPKPKALPAPAAGILDGPTEYYDHTEYLRHLTGEQLAADMLRAGDEGGGPLGFAIAALQTIAHEVEVLADSQQEHRTKVAMYALERRAKVAAELCRRAKDGAS